VYPVRFASRAALGESGVKNFLPPDSHAMILPMANISETHR